MFGMRDINFSYSPWNVLRHRIEPMLFPIILHSLAFKYEIFKEKALKVRVNNLKLHIWLYDRNPYELTGFKMLSSCFIFHPAFELNLCLFIYFFVSQPYFFSLKQLRHFASLLLWSIAFPSRGANSCVS